MVSGVKKHERVLASPNGEIHSKKLSNGSYRSANDVILEALQLLEEQDRLFELRREEIHNQIALGIEQLEHGDYQEYDEESLNELFMGIISRGKERLIEKKQEKSS